MIDPLRYTIPIIDLIYYWIIPLFCVFHVFSHLKPQIILKCRQVPPSAAGLEIKHQKIQRKSYDNEAIYHHTFHNTKENMVEGFTKQQPKIFSLLAQHIFA